MLPASEDIVIVQGATFRKTYWLGTVIDPDNGPTPDPAAVPPVNWTATDLSGAVGASQARATADAPDVLLTFDVIIDGPTGKVTQQLAAAASTALGPVAKREKIGVHDIELTLANGDVLRLAKGRVSLDPEVTRA